MLSLSEIVNWPQKQTTLHITNVPSLFHEPYISSGYRPPYKPLRYYLFSVCQLHNETVNVWTHLAAFLAILAQLYRLSSLLDFHQDKDAQTLIGFSIGCLLNTLLSACAHLLHSKSPSWHYVCFLVDYSGVTLYSFATVLGCVYVSSPPYVYYVIEPYVLPINIALSCIGFLTCCLAKLRYSGPYQHERQLLMVGALTFHAFFGALPLFARYIHCFYEESCSIFSLNHITIVFILLAACAVTFTAHLPERLCPGQFDIFGQGHQIFHVVSMITMLMELEGMYVDIKNGVSLHTAPSLTSMLVAYLVLILIHVAILVYLRGQIQEKVDNILKHTKSK